MMRRKKKYKHCLAISLVLLGGCLAFSLARTAKANVSDDETILPGGVLVKLLSDPKPIITVDTSNINEKTYIPVKLWGVVDNSETKWSSSFTIPKCGMSFIADLWFDGAGARGATENALSPQSLYDNINDAFVNNKSSFGMVLDDMPESPVSIDNMKGFNAVKDPTGRDVLRITLRGDSESGLTTLVLKYFFKGLPTGAVKNTINFSVNKNFLISKDGLSGDESPGKVNTKGQEIPAKGNDIVANVNFYDHNQCYGKKNFSEWAFIGLKTGAQVSQTLHADIPTWSEYLSPWDSEGEYNTDQASFNEVKGVTSQLPGGYLTPVINWNLKKDGLPTEEKIAKRFGRVVDYFDKTVDNEAHVTAKETKADQGKDFVLSDSDSGVLQRPITLKTNYQVINPDLTPSLSENSYGRQQTIPLKMNVTAPTSGSVTLWEAVDDGELKQIQTYDVSNNNPSDIIEEAAELPAIRQIGEHTLHFKLTDSNNAESGVKDLKVTIDQRELVTKDVEIRQYNSWDKSSGIVSVKDRQGSTVSADQVTKNGDVNIKKIGKYPVSYSYDGITNNNEVTVLESLAEINITKDIFLTVGDSFDPKSAFISAKDNDGNLLSYDKIVVQDSGNVDTHKSGLYKVIYSLGNIAPVSKILTVHVQKGGLSLSKLPKIQFPTLQLDGESHKLRPEDKEKNLVVTDLRGTDSGGWQLEAKYAGKTEAWDKNKLNLLTDLKSDNPVLNIPESHFTFNHDEQIICEVPEDSIPKEPLKSTLKLSPILKVPADIKKGEYVAIISWNLVEAPEE